MTGRPAAGIATLFVLAGALSASPASAQQAAAPAQASIGAVQAVITDVGPYLTREPGSYLRLRATIVNDSVAPVTRVRWRLRVAPPVTSRVGLTTPFDERGGSDVLWHDDAQVIDVLAAGERRDVSLVLALDDLDDFPAPDDPAVFPLRLEITHRLVNPIGSADTFLLWYPHTQPTVRVGWIVAVTDPPARTATMAIRGDALEQSVSPGGRLDAVLTALDRAEQVAGARVPVTLAVDAETVESVAALAAGSARVAADGSGPATQRIGSPAAAAWLQRLKVRAARHPVVALPYADADVAALVHAGLHSDVTAALRRAQDGPPGRDGPTLDTLLGVKTLSDIAWPVGEVADPATTDSLAGNGIRAVVLDRNSLRIADNRDHTTTAATEIDTSSRPLTAIVPDAPITSLADDMVGAGPLFRVAKQRLLAETAALHLERPYAARDVFVRFPRDWHPQNFDAVAELLALPVTTPWLTGTTIPDAVGRADRAGNRVRIPRYPPTARTAELPAAGLGAVQRLRGELESFRTILADSESPPPGTTDDERTAIADAALDIRTRLYHARDALSWSQSAHWRDEPARGSALRTSVDGVLHTLRGQVSVDNIPVRLTSTSGQVQITIRNRLGTPVRVRLSLRSQRLGLTFGSVREITVPAARPGLPGTQLVQVPAKAQTVGKFPVDAQLHTADDVALGDPARITVSTTAYGRVALMVTGAAFVLLVLATLTRVVFRRRRGRSGPPGDGATDPDPDSDSDPDLPPAAAAAGLPQVRASADA